MPSRIRKVVVLGLDGLEPALVDRLQAQGRLPHFSRLAEGRPVGRLATTDPAQTPVAWSSFATGVNPGRHGIFDFLRPDRRRYLPQVGLNTYRRRTFQPPEAVNLRSGTTLWSHLNQHDLPAVVLRCPCTFPPDPLRGRMLAGMGVPDLCGGFGRPTFYTSSPAAAPRENEALIHVQPTADGTVQTELLGPYLRNGRARARLSLRIRPSEQPETWTAETPGDPQSLPLRVGVWSDWLKLRFSQGLGRNTSGQVRLLLIRTAPAWELYASPVNFDPVAPPFTISHPPEYAADLEQSLGRYYTAGMPEDHIGYGNQRYSADAFLAHCDQLMVERERMFFHEWSQLADGLLFCLFDTPDRLQHLFWREHRAAHGDPRTSGSSPAASATATGGAPSRQDFSQVIVEHYQACDALLGRALDACDDQTLLLVCSDHGFGSFDRGVHLNHWLWSQGLLSLQAGRRPGEATSVPFDGVDWSRTRAYALGLAGIYLNLCGRESQGIVSPDEAPHLIAKIAAQLSELTDAERGATAIREAVPAAQLYHGPHAAEAPDVVLRFAAGYRASWHTTLGQMGDRLCEDNTRVWSGDHVIDPALIPGVLLSTAPLCSGPVHLCDLPATITAALRIPAAPSWEGSSHWPTD